MSSADHDYEAAQLPEDLPPVEPPSAGFIIQLFVVPGFIVAAIVGVYLLFGRLATSEQDWKSQVVELQHPNEHRRWRAALGLAQMLKADQELAGAGERLSENREIAEALSGVLTTELKRASHDEPELKFEAFLARTLGMFDLPETVVPALEQAMQSEVDREVRKNAMGAIAVIADRSTSGGHPLTYPGLADELITASRDSDPLIRQLGAFTLGLFSGGEVQSRLEVMLTDADADTRINAAIALARNGDARGAGVFREVLQGALQSQSPGTAVEYEQFLALKNCITAIEHVGAGLDEPERRELAALLEPISNDFREPKIRIAAKTALSALQQAH